MDQLLIVGGGLAGTLLALECHQRGIDFKWVISNQIPSASSAAYGMCNPVHLRNQVPAWKASESFEVSKTFFAQWNDQLGIDAFKPMPVNHLVTDDQELIRWRQNAESTELWKYTSGEPKHHFHPKFKNEFIAEIRINHSFYVNMPEFIQQAKVFLNDKIDQTGIDWESIPVSDHIKFKGSIYQKLIIADGVGGMKNPFFKYVPFNPCKGQILKVNIKGLELDEAIHKKIVLVPLGNMTYSCGATYEWTHINDHVTDEAKTELLNQLNDILGDKYQVTVVDQKAGIRPTISDRRPVVGWHPENPAIGILNGFGTRGLLVGPATCKNLLNNLENEEIILPEWDVQRFNKRFQKKME